MTKSNFLSDFPKLADCVGKTVIVYDGHCPFCSRFVAWQRLRENVGLVRLEDARNGGAVAKALWAAGYDLNEGMVLIWNGRIYHGDDCVHRLALLSSRSGLFNRINAVSYTHLTLPTKRIV